MSLACRSDQRGICVCVCVCVCVLSVGERTYQAKCVKAKLVKPEFQMLVQKC